MQKNYEHPTQALDMSNLFKHKLRHVYMKIRSDVISKALKLLVEWSEGYQNWVEETRQKVEVAAEQLDRGEGIDGEVVVERLREKLRSSRENLR